LKPVRETDTFSIVQPKGRLFTVQILHSHCISSCYILSHEHS